MFKNIRTPSLAIAITLACTPMANAFPPCPLDDTRLVPLDQSTGSNTSSWSSAIYSDAGSIAPVRIRVNCQQNFPEVLARVPSTGQCDEDVLMLDALPRSLSSRPLDHPLGYSKYGWVGYIGLPELRLPESIDKHNEYTFTLAVNTTRLAQPGDWVDIAEMTLVGQDDATPSTRYRLRKIHASSGTSLLQLISSTSVHEPGAPAHSILAVVPLDKNAEFQNVAMRWTTTSRTRNPPPLGSKPVVLPPSEYIVDTQLTVTVGANVIHQGALGDQMPNDIAMGILDYNLPHAAKDDGSTDESLLTLTAGSRDTFDAQTGSETTSSEQPSIPGMNEPGRTLIFPTATLRSRRI